MTVTKTPKPYSPTYADLANNLASAGDVAEADVAAVGTSLQYTGLVLNGDGTDANGQFPFLKVQEQNSDGKFEYAACYLGNNGASGSFGLSFFQVSSPFRTAHMTATRSGSTVTIEFTNVDGGTQANQTYTCTGAPSNSNTFIGVSGYANATARIDNFGNGSAVLDTFSFTGALASSGNWTDVLPGMNAVGGYAQGGFAALSYFTGSIGTGTQLGTVLPRYILAGQSVVMTLVGAGFVPGQTTINVGGGIAVTNVSVASASQMTATFTVPAGTAAERVFVSVTTPAGTSGMVRLLVL